MKMKIPSFLEDYLSEEAEERERLLNETEEENPFKLLIILTTT